MQTPTRNRTPPESVYNISGLEHHRHKHPVEEGSCSVFEVLKNGWASKDQGLINAKVKICSPNPLETQKPFYCFALGLQSCLRYSHSEKKEKKRLQD